MNTINQASPLKILLALDDSHHSAAAVDLLTRITWPIGTSVHIFAIVPDRLPVMERSPEMQRHVDEVLEVIRWRDWAVATTMIRKAAARLQAHHLNVQTEVDEGPPSQTLLKQAIRLQPDLVVLGAKGYSPADKFDLSPIAHKVAHEADYSVLVARPSPQVRPLNTILAVDGSPAAWRAVEFLGALALPQWARVTAVNVIEEKVNSPIGVSLTDYHRPADIEPVIPDPTEEVIARLHDHGVQVRKSVRFGHPADEILTAAQEQEADLIVIGMRSRSFDVGKVAQKVVKYAPCSVLAVRESENKKIASGYL